MKLTQFERMLLVNQLTIRKSLEKGDAEDLEAVIEILRCGYEVLYFEVSRYLGVYEDNEVMSAAKGEFVFDVLDLYRAIDIYKRQHPTESDIQDHFATTFHGFDGNNEAAYMALTRFLIEVRGLYAEQKPYARQTDNFNSHAPMIATYEAMLTRWRALEPSASGRKGPWEMTREQILSVLGDR